MQLCTEVRTSEDDGKNVNLNKIQIAQNKALRLMECCKIKDKVPVANMLEKFNMLSVNQTAASIKILEAWKSENISDYPIKLIKNNGIHKNEENSNRLRENSTRKWKQDCSSKKARSTFVFDTAKLWNATPINIKNCKSIGTVKKEIKLYCKKLPI